MPPLPPPSMACLLPAPLVGSSSPSPNSPITCRDAAHHSWTPPTLTFVCSKTITVLCLAVRKLMFKSGFYLKWKWNHLLTGFRFLAFIYFRRPFPFLRRNLSQFSARRRRRGKSGWSREKGGNLFSFLCPAGIHLYIPLSLLCLFCLFLT